MWPVKDLPTRPLQGAEASGLRKVREDLLALPAGHSAHLPEVVALLVQTAMGATVLSEAAVVGAREASPEVVLAAEAVLAAAVASQAVAAEVAEAVDQLRPIVEEEDPLILFFFVLSLTGTTRECNFR